MSIFSRIYTKGMGMLFNLIPAGGQEQALPPSAFYDGLWAYYLNNGLYDQLRLWGQYAGNTYLTECRNPCTRTVEFYPAVIWPGQLDQALPLVVDSENPNLEPAVKQLWQWSNWSTQRQVAVRWAAIMGDVYLKVSQSPSGAKRVYIQLLDPRHVTDKEEDERGYLTYLRLDIPRKRQGERYTHTEVWDTERYRVWEHKHGAQADLSLLGTPTKEMALSEWGIDFVPAVHVRHINIGGDSGIGCFALQTSKIDEANVMASRLHKMLFRHNDVTWALKANAEDGKGRPLPPPRILNAEGQETDILELGSDRIIKLPGNSSLESLVPNLNYTNSLEILEAQLAEIERDLPETMFFRTKDLPEMSGKALRLLLSPAIARAHEVRGNHEDALVRVQKMALTIGQAIGAWAEAGLGDVGDYQAGDFEHHFADRPIIQTGRDEVAEIATMEVGAGIPLITSLRNSGWTEDELAQMAEDKAAETQAQQQSLATALLNAQEQMGGASSNGLEQPQPPAGEDKPA